MTTYSPLATVSATRAVLERHGLATKHALGQNFLVNDAILGKIIALSDANPDDYVVEVGPGIGTLSLALLQNAGAVVAIERDADLPAVLHETTAPWADKFHLIQMDALDFSPEMLPVDFPVGGVCQAPNKLISNLPYAVAATVILDYFQRFGSVQSATVMVQKEVADRIMAVPGTKNYGAYTVKLSLYAQPAGRFAVGPGNFFPPPRVESAVVRLDRRVLRDDDGAAMTEEMLQAVCTMADAAFASRRKTIANSFKAYFAADVRWDSDSLDSVLDMAGIDPKRRGETLFLEEFIALGRAFLACKVL